MNVEEVQNFDAGDSSREEENDNLYQEACTQIGSSPEKSTFGNCSLPLKFLGDEVVFKLENSSVNKQKQLCAFMEKVRDIKQNEVYDLV